MRSSSQPVSNERKKNLVLGFSRQEDTDTFGKKISDNGSLVFSQFRLNDKGITLTGKVQPTTCVPSKYFKDLHLEEFESICPLGSGNYGSVDKVLHKPTQEIYALKKIRYVSNDVQESFLKKELKALIDCNSEYIVQCYVPVIVKKGEIYILMEYMDMGSLQVIVDKVKKIPESLAMIIIQQVLLGLEYLHDVKKIIHRDIKPHNILVNKKGEVKIADFGICSVSEKSDPKFLTFIGTVQYMSPERLNGEEYSYDSDIWSVGMMTLQCLTGILPLVFNNKTMSMIVFIQLTKKFNIDEYLKTLQLSENTCSFISQCLQQDVQIRAQASTLLASKAIKYTQTLKMEQFKLWLQLAIEEL